MDAINYSELNTLISVKESAFISSHALNQLLVGQDDESLVLLLQNTDYHFNEADLNDTGLIEKKLMQELIHEFHFAFTEAPQPQVVEIFTLKFVYHNLKMLLMTKATQMDLSHLLIPIGRYSINELRHVAQTLESTIVTPVMIDEVRATWNEYQAYTNTDVINIGMDMAYFKHLRVLETTIDNEQVSQVIDAIIDFYNVTTAKRGLEQRKAHSDIHRLMSDEGTYPIREVIELVKTQQIATWFNEINQIPFNKIFEPYVTKMNEGTIKNWELEALSNVYVHILLTESRFITDGPLPILRYLHGKEMEVKNLRMILTGRANQLSTEDIKERMRPVYGETL